MIVSPSLQLYRRSSPIRLIAGIVAWTAIIALIPVAAWGRQVYTHVVLLQGVMQEAQSLAAQGLKLENAPHAVSLLTRAQGTVGNIQADVAPLYPLIRKLASFPVIGHPLAQVEPLMEYAASLAQAGVVLGEATRPLWQDQQNPTSELSQPQEFVRLMAEKEADFELADTLLGQAAAAQAQIDSGLIPPIYRAEWDALNSFLPQAQALIDALRIAPRLLGSIEPQTYLIMVQNRDELRASGGFITAFGLLRMDEGMNSMTLVEDSTWFDYVSEVRQPPQPLGYLMEASYLVPRDANWSPDFPTAALQTEEMYALATKIPVDGVIAFDQGFIVSLLDFLGPVSISAGEAPIDAANVERRMIQYKEAAIAAGNPRNRKEFMDLLAPVFFEKFYSIHQRSAQIRLMRNLVNLIQEGHLAIYFNDPQAQTLLHQYGLDGAVDPGTGDFLMLVDSNVGFGKTDIYIKRSLSYEVNLQDPANPRAVIQLQYQHTQYGSEPCKQGVSHNSGGYYYPRCYWDYWRVLALRDSVLENAILPPLIRAYFEDPRGWDNEVTSAPGEGGTQMFAGLVVVPQAHTRQVTLETRLPGSVLQIAGENELSYSLRIQKQAGIAHLPLHILVHIPRGYTLLSSSAGWTYDSDHNFCTWQGDLTQSGNFVLEFIRAGHFSNPE